jgi:tyrosine-protein phosphatase YwqE
MFGLFKSSKVEADLSFIGVDMHSHLLPGLDDGLANIEETIDFARELKAWGYQKLICTPHILEGVHPNTPETILPKLELVQKAFVANGLDMQVEAAAEYMVDASFEQLLKSEAPLLTFGKKHILIEMSYLAASPKIDQAIFDLKVNGYQPILAHPERYSYYHGQWKQYQRIADMGCWLQVNLLSLSGYYGPQVKKVGEQLIKAGLIDLIGTDMHHEKHLRSTEAFITHKDFYKLLQDYPFKNKQLL